MTLLILGLIIFIGVHSVRIVAPGWRNARQASMGENPWKGMYSVLSIIGFVLMIYGYGQARDVSETVYDTPSWAGGMANIVVPIALILLAASQLPRGYIKAAVGHPMLWAVLLWSAAHLLANGDTASVLLFGVMLIWSVANLASCYSRPAGDLPAPKLWTDLASVVIGIVVTGALIMGLHVWLFGVVPA
ncbi:MAG: NnrU family protein [Pseudomonadota bacterium]